MNEIPYAYHLEVRANMKRYAKRLRMMSLSFAILIIIGVGLFSASMFQLGTWKGEGYPLIFILGIGFFLVGALAGLLTKSKVSRANLIAGIAEQIEKSDSIELGEIKLDASDVYKQKLVQALLDKGNLPGYELVETTVRKIDAQA